MTCILKRDRFEQKYCNLSPYSELPRIERNSGGFRTFNNLVKIQFTDKIDSIFVILVKFRSYIHFPVHSYVFNTPAIAVTSSSTYLLFYIKCNLDEIKMLARTATIRYF